jgi:tRNA pseudouridine55 synthase
MADIPEMEGVLLIDKPSGMTSHDVVSRLRRKLQMKRIGHAGTLDPAATGVLILLVGKATKLSQYLMSVDKEYEGIIRLGQSTNTQDGDGETVSTRPVPELTSEQVRRHLRGFLGDQYQTPPMFSAIKMQGVALYKLARKGEEVEREPRFIRVSQFELLDFTSPDIAFRLRCSKGTYVRTIAHDLGERIGCGAHLAKLRRTAADRFTAEQSIELAKLEEMPLSEIEKRLIPGHEAAPTVAL